ncbi:uncharacterized protein BP5553_05869 [Venustampulla echinocandica]|uniref:Uncharacterized protein n=1 Tax=Venustampulla echinocandica TaxID=2656787 RepID=A0A370TLX6_9HELO|nr:uncharacterized protein BP5553_05869 [Venustampulla echinocandica]RDL36517.1 hypothetical protein BP5553_05869 [Venustampulla echinocandica]
MSWRSQIFLALMILGARTVARSMTPSTLGRGPSNLQNDLAKFDDCVDSVDPLPSDALSPLGMPPSYPTPDLMMRVHISMPSIPNNLSHSVSVPPPLNPLWDYVSSNSQLPSPDTQGVTLAKRKASQRSISPPAFATPCELFRLGGDDAGAACLSSRNTLNMSSLDSFSW